MKRIFMAFTIILTLLTGSFAFAATAPAKYEAIGIKDDKIVENFAKTIVDLVKNDKKDKIADLVKYPLSTKIAGKKTTIADKAAFIKNYSKIVTADLKKEIVKAKTTDLFARYNGVMLGGNSKNIWFNNFPKNNKPVLFIVGFNN